MLLACLAGACFFSSQATAGTLTGTVVTPTPSTPVNLTAEGTLDWAEWGFGGNPYAFNDMAPGSGPISDFTQIGDLSQAVFGYSPTGVPLIWDNGDPTLSANGDQEGIYVGYQGGNGFQFTVPADMTPKFLKIYTGCYGEQLHLNASLSDASAPAYDDYSVTDPTESGVTGVYTIKFAAASSGQTLTVNMDAGANVFDTNYANTTLQAASLFGQAAAIGGNQPASQTNWVGLNAQLTVEASGDPGVPLAYQWWVEANRVFVPVVDGSQISGSTSPTLTISNLVFANATNYFVVVTNVYGTATSSVASLTVLPITGALNGTTATAPATANLTAEGTLDWAHWGLNVATDFDDKEGGGNQISNITLIGPSQNGPFQYGNALVAYSWSDGTPDTTAAGTTTGVYFNDFDNGYQITVPADTTKRILRVYAGGWNTTVHFGASLSDESAPPYIDESLVTGPNDQAVDVYTIDYAAASAGQTLTVTVYNLTYGGNCTLMAATLSGPSPNIVNPPASQTGLLGYSAQFTAQAEGWSPLAYQWWEESGGVYVPLADGGQISGSTTPTLTINNLLFANATNYYVVVTNVYGAVTSSVASLTVLPPTGTMQGGVDTNIASLTVVNLTAEGTLDWADWGLTNVNDFNDKAVGGAPVGLISNWALYGTISYGPTLDNYGDQPYGLSWTDGTPTASATTTGHGTANYVYVGSLGAGFQITVPADTTKKVLKLYYMGWDCRTRIMATLSDNSAPTFINDSVDDPAGDIAYGVATILFAAGSVGQTLTVTEYDVLDYAGGNVGITAATLVRPVPITLTYSRSGPSLQLTWPYGTLLQATNVTGPWTVSGNASPPSYTVTPVGPQMFYRVQVQ
jgi:hypothetical protein